ncbi:MAG: MutS N-terminal domain-containing protein [Planctomycetota bacterium]
MSSETPAQLDTPAMRQYRQFKEQYPDYLLLFRMGDFYELFYEDAKIASRDLGLALTARSKGPSAVPLAGMPYHALDSYLARLIRAGHRVAICEQVEDPKQAKGVVKRDVVRLVTPGTLTDETLLDQREGNYLAAVVPAGKNSGPAGLAWVELSSGQFHAMLTPADHVLDELIRIGAAEVLLPEESRFDGRGFRDMLAQCTAAIATGRPPWAFDAHSAAETLKDHFQVATLEGFGFDGWDASLSAAGAVIEYLRETQKTALGHIRALRKFDRTGHMVIDGNTLRCLEVHRTLRSNQRAGSLLACIDETCTGMGARMLERWLTFPLTGYSDIVARQDAVEDLTADRNQLTHLRDLLRQTAQIDRIAANIALARVRPRELAGSSPNATTPTSTVCAGSAPTAKAG